jgi:hypothetical protein
VMADARAGFGAFSRRRSCPIMFVNRMLLESRGSTSSRIARQQFNQCADRKSRQRVGIRETQKDTLLRACPFQQERDVGKELREQSDKSSSRPEHRSKELQRRPAEERRCRSRILKRSTRR